LASSFRLQKWYLDAVDHDGQVFIGYWAILRWGWLNLHYQGYLHQRSGAPTKHVNRFRRSPAPVEVEDRVDWRVPGVDGHWHSRSAPIRRQLLNNEHGTVDWHAIMPSASATIRFQDGHLLNGLGYVEHLDMTIPPWKLPIQRLHWGRAISAADAVVWIRWESHTHPLALVHHLDFCGKAQTYQQDTQVTKENVAFPDGYVRMNEPRSLRTGIISQTVFQQVGWIKWFFPRSIQQLEETKWLSRSYLESQQNTSTGWAIHEIVDWV
jgi:hypothetical protein